jgi:hypothetical protein
MSLSACILWIFKVSSSGMPPRVQYHCPGNINGIQFAVSGHSENLLPDSSLKQGFHSFCWSSKKCDNPRKYVNLILSEDEVKGNWLMFLFHRTPAFSVYMNTRNSRAVVGFIIKEQGSLHDPHSGNFFGQSHDLTPEISLIYDVKKIRY